MKYQITSTSTNIAFANAGSKVSLYNDGPSTIYLDENSAINTNDAFPLPPMASTEWQIDSALWARCNKIVGTDGPIHDGFSSLYVNRAGTLVDASRTSVDKKLITISDYGAQLFANPLEVTAYKSLILKLYVADYPGATEAVTTYFYNWFDEGLNIIERQEVDMWIKPTVVTSPTYMTVTIPVRGAFLGIQAVGDEVDAITKVEVYGTTRILPYRWHHPHVISWSNHVFPYTAFPSGAGEVAISGIDADEIHLPGWGKKLAISVVLKGPQSITNELQVYIKNPFVDRFLRVKTLEIPALVGPTRRWYELGEFAVPLGQVLIFSMAADPEGTAGDHKAIFNWTEYNEIQ